MIYTLITVDLSPRSSVQKNKFSFIVGPFRDELHSSAWVDELKKQSQYSNIEYYNFSCPTGMLPDAQDVATAIIHEGVNGLRRFSTGLEIMPPYNSATQ